MSSREASSNHISIGDPPRRKLNEYRSREVAEELCLMDSELLRKIDTAELQNGAWMKKDKVCGGGEWEGESWREGGERERERDNLILWFVPHLQKYSLAPNIMAMVSSFNQLALLIPSEILEEQTPHARAKVISNFIKVSGRLSQRLLMDNNYGSYGFVIHN